MSRIRMRPVTTTKMQSMRRGYNRAIDGESETDQVVVDPYQSMYSQAFGGRLKGERGQSARSGQFSTPQQKKKKPYMVRGNQS